MSTSEEKKAPPYMERLQKEHCSTKKSEFDSSSGYLLEDTVGSPILCLYFYS